MRYDPLSELFNVGATADYVERLVARLPPEVLAGGCGGGGGGGVLLGGGRPTVRARRARATPPTRDGTTVTWSGAPRRSSSLTFPHRGVGTLVSAIARRRGSDAHSCPLLTHDARTTRSHRAREVRVLWGDVAMADQARERSTLHVPAARAPRIAAGADPKGARERASGWLSRAFGETADDGAAAPSVDDDAPADDDSPAADDSPATDDAAAAAENDRDAAALAQKRKWLQMSLGEDEDEDEDEDEADAAAKFARRAAAAEAVTEEGDGWSAPPPPPPRKKADDDDDWNVGAWDVGGAKIALSFRWMGGVALWFHHAWQVLGVTSRVGSCPLKSKFVCLSRARFSGGTAKPKSGGGAGRLFGGGGGGSGSSGSSGGDGGGAPSTLARTVYGALLDDAALEVGRRCAVV